MAANGTLYLIPTPLGNVDPRPSLPPLIGRTIESITLFVVEKPKTAMRFLGRMGMGKRLEGCVFVPTDRLDDPTTISELLAELAEGKNIGVLSEAGCPGVADPGSLIVRAAHSQNLPVVPLVGPSSVVLALMASGFNGQEFTFHGYLPVKRSERIERLRQIEQRARKTGCTQIFIEAPHRNDHLFSDIVDSCRPDTMFCIACDLTLPEEYIRTKSIGEWRRAAPALGKRPAIFLIGPPFGQGGGRQ